MMMKVTNKAAEGEGAEIETQTTTMTMMIERVGGDGQGHPTIATMAMTAVRGTLQNEMTMITTTEMMTEGGGARPPGETRNTTGKVGEDEAGGVMMTIMMMTMMMTGEGGIDRDPDLLSETMIWKKAMTEGGEDGQDREGETAAMIDTRTTGEGTVPNLVDEGVPTTTMKIEGGRGVVDQNQGLAVRIKITTRGVMLVPSRRNRQNPEIVDSIDKI